MVEIDVEKLRSYVNIENAWDARTNEAFNKGAIRARNKML